jgi:hypothetical protein
LACRAWLKEVVIVGPGETETGPALYWFNSYSCQLTGGLVPLPEGFAFAALLA